MLRTCVRSSRLSLYARTQRLTENAPYKGLWLVVKTTTNQPHSVKCRKAALASIHPNSQNGNQGEMAVIRPFICLLPFWEQAKSEGQNDPLKTGRAVHTGQLARCRSAEDAVLCPSDMMLCVISYWVLSGAKRRQIQQLRCCVLPAKLLKRRDVYLKLTRHNGRAGAHGTYNPKHNDRSFNLANSEHIDPERAKGNIYWDCFHGFRSALDPQDPDDLAATFSDVDGSSTKPTTRPLLKARTNATPRSGTQSATALFTTCCPAARPARKRPSTNLERWMNTPPQRTC